MSTSACNAARWNSRVLGLENPILGNHGHLSRCVLTASAVDPSACAAPNRQENGGRTYDSVLGLLSLQPFPGGLPRQSLHIIPRRESPRLEIQSSPGPLPVADSADAQAQEAGELSSRHVKLLAEVGHGLARDSAAGCGTSTLALRSGFRSLHGLLGFLASRRLAPAGAGFGFGRRWCTAPGPPRVPGV